MRTPVALYLLAFAVRAAVFAVFPDPAYADSTYYVEVARAIASGHGLSVDFVWVFAEVGNRLPDPAVLPIASNAHWLPLTSLIQAPFVTVLGPTALASALPGLIIGALAAPLTWFIARDMGARPIIATAAAVIVAIPGALTVFMAQPETFPLTMVLVPATLWCLARALRGDGRAFVLAGLLAGLMTLARNDGILLAGTVALVWFGDRWRAWRTRHGRRSWSHVDDGAPIPVLAAVLAMALFLLVVAPWWARQLEVFGSISPTSSSGAALWIRSIDEWNSLTAQPTLQSFLDQGFAAIIASRLDGLVAALGIFVVLVTSVVLLPFLLVGMLARRHSVAVQPWFGYTLVVFAGATLLYPLHVPGGTFIHTAAGLLPYVAILSMEGLVLLVGAVAGRRRQWEERTAGRVFVWGIVAIVVATAFVFGKPVIERWRADRDARTSLAAALDRAGAPPTDRVLSIDPGAVRYWTGHPGVVTTNDPIETVRAVAQAYDIRWLVLERADFASSMTAVLAGARPSWIGAPVFTIPSASGGSPALALYPVCVAAGDARCGP